jgi:predicted amidophosphoribosyltransferase
MRLAIAEALLDLLLPAVCPACRCGAGPLLCTPCRSRLPLLPHPCAWCGAPRRDPAQVCRSCGGQGFAHLHRVVVAYAYAGLVEDLVGDAKAGGRPAAARALGGLLPPLPGDRPGPPTLVPIPPARGRRPGPHLGTMLARALARRDGLAVRPLLATTRLAAEQHLLTAGERRTNVAGLFACRVAAPAYVMLVDDLVTSGATASAAAAILRAAGARRVDLLCLARTPRRVDQAVAGTVTAPTAGSS